MEELLKLVFDLDFPTIQAQTGNKYTISTGDIYADVTTASFIPPIEKVIYNKPATIIKWDDGTKTVVKCDEHDIYDPEKGLLIAILKKFYGNKGSFYKDMVMPWLPEKEKV